MPSTSKGLKSSAATDAIIWAIAVVAMMHHPDVASPVW
jgi:hypothetical protein